MKHNNFKQRVLTLALAGVFVFGSVAIGVNSYAASATADATATVVTPIAIAAANPDLRFGSFSTTAAAQTVAIATDGDRTLVGALGLGTGQNAFGAASFAVTGEGTLTYAITLPTSAVEISDGQGTPDTMNVTNFVSNPSGTGTLTDGSQTLLVGATLTTLDSQEEGDYTGTFNTIVEYN